MCAHLDPMHPVVTVGPFEKLGVDFTTFHLASIVGHKYIIVVVDYFTKWVEAITNFSNDGKIVSMYMFNHIVTQS